MKKSEAPREVQLAEQCRPRHLMFPSPCLHSLMCQGTNTRPSARPSTPCRLFWGRRRSQAMGLWPGPGCSDSFR